MYDYLFTTRSRYTTTEFLYSTQARFESKHFFCCYFGSLWSTSACAVQWMFGWLAFALISGCGRLGHTTIHTTPACSVLKYKNQTVKAELTQINTRKATTSDDYPSWVTKEFAEFLCEPLTDIINTMFKQQKYPDVWKYAEVIPVPKLKSPSQCKEFRPISLLFHCGKVAEKLFAKEYKKSVLPKISSAQYAYQPGLGTTDAIIYTLENWIKQFPKPLTPCNQEDYLKPYSL